MISCVESSKSLVSAAPDCSACFRCGTLPLAKPGTRGCWSPKVSQARIADARAADGDCGPEGRHFEPIEGGAA